MAPSIGTNSLAACLCCTRPRREPGPHRLGDSVRRRRTLVTVFAEGEEDKIDVVAHFWLAGDLREHEDTDKTPYGLWRQQGYLQHRLPIKSLAIVRRPSPANPTRQVDGTVWTLVRPKSPRYFPSHLRNLSQQAGCLGAGFVRFALKGVKYHARR
jgi:hypothetical protein